MRIKVNNVCESAWYMEGTHKHLPPSGQYILYMLVCCLNHIDYFQKFEHKEIQIRGSVLCDLKKIQR